jgi:hypothetical protein
MFWLTRKGCPGRSRSRAAPTNRTAPALPGDSPCAETSGGVGTAGGPPAQSRQRSSCHPIAQLGRHVPQPLRRDPRIHAQLLTDPVPKRIQFGRGRRPRVSRRRLAAQMRAPRAASLEDTARATVFHANPSRRATSRCEHLSSNTNRRISACCCTPTTRSSSPDPRGSGIRPASTDRRPDLSRRRSPVRIRLGVLKDRLEILRFGPVRRACVEVAKVGWGPFRAFPLGLTSSLTRWTAGTCVSAGGESPLAEAWLPTSRRQLPR